MAKQKQINWFGNSKPINKKKQQFSFLGKTPAKKTNYLGLTGKYGDRDMDGSPNCYDCKPRDVRRDGKFAEALKRKLISSAKRSYPYTPIKQLQKKQAEKIYGRKVEAVDLGKTRLKELQSIRIEKSKLAGRELKKNKEERRTEKSLQKKLTSLDVAQYEKNLRTAQEKETKVQGRIKRFTRVARNILPAGTMSGGALSSSVIKVGPDKYNLRKEQTARAQSYFNQPQQQMQMERIKQEINKRNLGGRPTGTYTHSIPGVGPVHVYVWRKWMRQQKALARLNASQIQPQNVAPEAMAMNQQGIDTSQMTPEQIQMMQQYQLEQQQMITNPELEAQRIDQLPAENKFTQNLKMLQAAYQREQYNRLVNEQPKGFVQMGVRQRQLLTQQQRDFSRRNSLLNAHKAMLTPQENAIDFLDNKGTEANILDTRNNNIMAYRPDSIDILNTGRRNILQADALPDVSQGNIMNAERLNFGKIKLTDEENII